MTFFIKGPYGEHDGFKGTWTSVVKFFVKGPYGEHDGFKGTWTSVQKAFVKVNSSSNPNGVWKLFWSGNLVPEPTIVPEISQSTNSTTKLITLTGTNYPWTNATSLSYDFIRTVPNTSDLPLDNGSISNPITSNTKTFLLTEGFIIPNQTNTFIFKVTGVNDTYGTTNPAQASLEIEGIRDITGLVNTIIDYDFLQFEWDSYSGLYANSYVYQYQTYSGVEPGGTWSSETLIPITDDFAGIINLQPNTQYRFRIKGITGTTLENQGYSGNYTYQTATTISAPAPVVLTSPTISGNGNVFSTINGVSGTYSSGTYQSKTSYIAKTSSDTLPTSGLTTTPLYLAGSPPYTVTQDDVTSPKSYFYYVDKVKGNDNNYYYYYSSQVAGSMIFPIDDDFNRTTSLGLGTMTYGGINPPPAPYSYNLNTSGSTLWSTNGSVAVISSAVSGTNPSSYPQQAIELGGKTDATISASFPAGPDGLGLTFWVTSAGSWWASTVNRTASTINKYVYYTLSTQCNTIGTSNDPNLCGTGTETVLGPCTPGTGTAQNNCGSTQTCPDNGMGSTSSNCKTRTLSLCPDNSTGNFYTNCKSRTVSVCTDNGNGSSGNYCKTRSVQTCPNNGIGSTSSNCKTRSVSTCPANGSGSSAFNCGVRTSPTCPDNGTGSAGSNCKSRTVSTQTCPNNGIGSTSSNCKSRIVTTYSCPNGYSLIGTNCYQNSFPYAVTSATATNTTVYDNYVTTTSTVYDSAGTVTVYDLAQTATVYDNYQTVTAYDVAGTSTVYDSATTQTIYDNYVYTYSGQTTTTNTIYYIYGCTIGPVTQYGGTLPTNCSNTTSTATVYNTDLKILNGNGSTVSQMDSQNIFYQEESPSSVGGMSVQTSGDTISTTLYSDIGRTSAITTKNYTASSPTKTNGSGGSYFGMIKTPPGSSGGTQFDNLNIV